MRSVPASLAQRPRFAVLARRAKEKTQLVPPILMGIPFGDDELFEGPTGRGRGMSSHRE